MRASYSSKFAELSQKVTKVNRMEGEMRRRNRSNNVPFKISERQESEKKRVKFDFSLRKRCAVGVRSDVGGLRKAFSQSALQGTESATYTDSFI